MNKIIYSGSFDPATLGHLDLINRILVMFPDYKLIVAVANNLNKKSLFSLEERVNMLKEIFLDNDSVEIFKFDGLLVDFVKKHNAKIIVRGLRAISDFEYELQLALTNRKIGNNIETIFLMPKEKYIYISSSMIKEIAMLGGDIEKFVHPLIEKEIRKKFKNYV